jgi:hypothetical protein
MLKVVAYTDKAISFSLPDKLAGQIHSIVLIGSHAVGTAEEGSDIDIVVVCRKDSCREIYDYLFDREAGSSEHKANKEGKPQYVCFDEDKIQQVFDMGSPMAFAIKKSRVLKDDGFLENFLKRNHPQAPTREYYLFALDSLAWRYFHALNSFETEIREDHADDGLCMKNGKCIGHIPADMLAAVIMRMLYITLPATGYMPYSKKDVRKFAEKVYGRHITEILDNVFNIHRHGVFSITLDEYRLLKPFAVKLFREVLRIVGLREDTLKILRKAAMVCRR